MSVNANHVGNSGFWVAFINVGVVLVVVMDGSALRTRQ